MIRLRDFQAEMIQATRLALRSHRSVLLQSPTGSGKTVMASFMVQSAIAKGGRPWFMVNRDYLVEQTSRTFDEIGIPHGFVAAGREWNPYRPSQICSVDTLKRRLDRIPENRRPTLLIVDESAHAAAAGWAKVLAWAHDAKVVGLSATPERLDGKPLNDYFDAMVPGPSVEWLIGEKYLSSYRAYMPSSPDLTGVHTRAGDYATDEIADVMDRSVLIGDMVQHWKRIAPGTKAMYFAVNVAHAEHIAASFRAAGVPAQAIDGSTATFERKKAARALADGDINILVSVSLAIEGYDLAAQAGRDVTVDCVGMARPTQSLSMYLQMIGRGLRPKPHPCIILDHASNIRTHGLPDDAREWSLEGRPKKKKSDPSAPAPRVCLSCFGAFAATARACPYCGTSVVAAPREIEHVDGELEEVDVEALRRERKMQERDARTIDELIAVAQARNYAKPEAWAAHMWTGRQRARARFAQGDRYAKE